MNIGKFNSVVWAVAFVLQFAIVSGDAWAESCSTTTIGHRSAGCLTASKGLLGATLTNACETSAGATLGVVAAEITVEKTDGNDRDHLILLRNNRSVSYLLASDERRVKNMRCCPSSGICQSSDCDMGITGVINDMTHAPHCNFIDNNTGRPTSGLGILGSSG